MVRRGGVDLSAWGEEDAEGEFDYLEFADTMLTGAETDDALRIRVRAD